MMKLNINCEISKTSNGKFVALAECDSFKGQGIGNTMAVALGAAVKALGEIADFTYTEEIDVDFEDEQPIASVTHLPIPERWFLVTSGFTAGRRCKWLEDCLKDGLPAYWVEYEESDRFPHRKPDVESVRFLRECNPPGQTNLFATAASRRRNPA